MTREIKFRAWSSELEEMIYTEKESKYSFIIFSDGSVIIYEDYHEIYNFDEELMQSARLKDKNVADIYEDYHEIYNFDEELMQSTGLKDKNGVDIYEGDLMNGGDRIVKIVWNENIASFDCFFVKYLNEDNFKLPLTIEPYNFKYFEIIGNEYQNPELLK